jgi:ubiquinone/menaquinone biosynthesis C-methylase UbiE
VLDIGFGHGEFINNIDCKVKYAVDLNRESAKFLSAGIEFFQADAHSLPFIYDDSIDVVFISNFSEHLSSKEELIAVFLEIRRILRPSGKLLLLGPNIRYVYKEYWDFFDHHIPLSHKAIIESLRALNFSIYRAIPRFLPYTSKSGIPKCSFLVWLYLKFPPVWQILGGQMFIVASKI